MQRLGNGGYILDTTAGSPIAARAGVLAPLGRLLRAVGPFHPGDKKIPEWVAQKRYPDDPENKVWKIITYGVLTTTKKIYGRDNIMCDTDIVEDGAGSNYADGCYTYNYSISGSEPWGYIGRPGGLHAGGPFIPKPKKSDSVSDTGAQFSNLPSCTSTNVGDLVPGESCNHSDGKFQMSPESELEREHKRHKTKETPLTDEN